MIRHLVYTAATVFVFVAFLFWFFGRDSVPQSIDCARRTPQLIQQVRDRQRLSLGSCDRSGGR